MEPPEENINQTNVNMGQTSANYEQLKKDKRIIILISVFPLIYTFLITMGIVGFIADDGLCQGDYTGLAGTPRDYKCEPNFLTELVPFFSILSLILIAVFPLPILYIFLLIKVFKKSNIFIEKYENENFFKNFKFVVYSPLAFIIVPVFIYILFVISWFFV